MEESANNDIRGGNQEVPDDFTVENSIYNGFELTWPPFAGKGGLYQVSMKKVGTFRLVPKIIYKGDGTRYIVTGLDPGTEYEFRLKCKYDNGWGDWSRANVKKVGELDIKIAVNTLKKYSENEKVCEDILSWIGDEITDGKQPKTGRFGHTFQFLNFSLSTDRVTQTEILDLGIIKVTMNIMRMYINNDVLCTYGCFTLFKAFVCTGNK